MQCRIGRKKFCLSDIYPKHFKALFLFPSFKWYRCRVYVTVVTLQSIKENRENSAKLKGMQKETYKYARHWDRTFSKFFCYWLYIFSSYIRKSPHGHVFQDCIVIGLAVFLTRTCLGQIQVQTHLNIHACRNICMVHWKLYLFLSIMLF